MYRNLNALGEVFSIKDKKSGLVIAHADGFVISDVKCKVSEAGRQQVIRDNRKNVHAALDGVYQGEVTLNEEHLDELTYNPYKNETFINKRTYEPIFEANKVYFTNGKAYLIP
ncbi:hypothetical protein ACSTWY_12845 [Rossellomorea marisflavi]